MEFSSKHNSPAHRWYDSGYIGEQIFKIKIQKMNTPKFAPPSWVFPVAWTSLYITMGVAKNQFDKTPKTDATQSKGNIAYMAQLSLNFMWSFLFFRWNLRGTALIDAILLWTTVVLNTYYFYQKSRPAGTLMMPYICWTSYAIALNYDTWKMNRH